MVFQHKRDTGHSYTGVSKSHVNKLPVTYQCHTCDFSAQTPVEFANHMSESHSLVLDVKNLGYRSAIDHSKKTCAFCEDIYDGPLKYKSHLMRKHSDQKLNFGALKLMDLEKPVTCKTCMSTVTHERQIFEHNRVCSEALLPLQCSRCYYVSGSRHMLRQHELRHTKELPRHACHLCAYTTFKRVSMFAHLEKVHGVEYPVTMRKNIKFDKRKVDSSTSSPDDAETAVASEMTNDEVAQTVEIDYVDDLDFNEQVVY